jgi:uncharacterized metal-binding protein YceD (DUF177 family)
MLEPFSRIVRVDTVPRDGETVTIEANAEERAALAALMKLPAIESLSATLTLKRAAKGGAWVTGAVHGAVLQTCVVSLEPFPATVEEDIDVRFAPSPDERAARRRGPEEPEIVSFTDDDEPDPIIEGKIDLGALAREFLALGLDPYPRKPGVAFEPPSEPEPEATPFAVLRREPKKPD